MLAIDYTGVAQIITAIFAGIAAVVGALAARAATHTSNQVSTNGDPRTLGQIATDVANTIGATSEKSPVPGETPAETKPADETAS